MINLAISVPGKFYTDAITEALEKTGNFRVWPMTEAKLDTGMEHEQMGNAPPDIVLLGVSVHSGYTLGERHEVIRRLRAKQSGCRIVVFIDELVSPEQTAGVKELKQARLIDGFLYASGTMEYLVATLESI